MGIPMPDRPTVLFLTYFFPPLQAVGAIRAASIAKHLSRVGWEVSVVTPAPDLWQACDDPERTAAEIRDWGVRMIHTGHRWRCLSSGSLKRSNRRDGARWLMEAVPRFLARRMRIDEMIGWYPEAERACAQLRPGEVDVVMATGSPFGAFGIAERLARRLECPYVLDYRDLWSGNPHNRRGRGARRERTEQRLLTGCAALSVVSSSMARYLGDRFGVAEKVHVIPNGYDPDDFASIEPTPFDHLAIVYAGQFLPPKRDAGPLMRMLRQVAESQPTRTWRFHYYGPSGDHVCQAAKIHNVEQLVELHGVTPRRQCLAAIRGANRRGGRGVGR